jgi:hypothetical protein
LSLSGRWLKRITYGEQSGLVMNFSSLGSTYVNGLPEILAKGKRIAILNVGETFRVVAVFLSFHSLSREFESAIE